MLLSDILSQLIVVFVCNNVSFHYIEKSQGKIAQKYARILRPYFEVHLCHPCRWRSLYHLICWLLLSRLVPPCSRSQQKRLCACVVSRDRETDTAERQPSMNRLSVFRMDQFPQLLLVSASQMLLLARCRSAQWRERATLAVHRGWLWFWQHCQLTGV